MTPYDKRIAAMHAVDAATCGQIGQQLALAGAIDHRVVFDLVTFAIDPDERCHDRHTVRAFCERYGLRDTTYHSRWTRARCSAKATVARIWLLRVLALLADGWRAADVADYLGYSSLQAMDRSVKTTLGLNRGDWHERATLDAGIASLIEHLRPLTTALHSVRDSSSAATLHRQTA